MIDYEKLYLKAMNRIAELETVNESIRGACAELDAALDRIAELETALEHRERDECCQDYKAKQAARIAELEAANQWHDASEPPVIGRRIHIDFMDKSYSSVIVDKTEL